MATYLLDGFEFDESTPRDKAEAYVMKKRAEQSAATGTTVPLGQTPMGAPPSPGELISGLAQQTQKPGFVREVAGFAGGFVGGAIPAAMGIPAFSPIGAGVGYGLAKQIADPSQDLDVVGMASTGFGRMLDAGSKILPYGEKLAKLSPTAKAIAKPVAAGVSDVAFQTLGEEAGLVEPMTQAEKFFLGMGSGVMEGISRMRAPEPGFKATPRGKYSDAVTGADKAAQAALVEQMGGTEGKRIHNAVQQTYNEMAQELVNSNLAPEEKTARMQELSALMQKTAGLVDEGSMAKVRQSLGALDEAGFNRAASRINQAIDEMAQGIPMDRELQERVYRAGFSPEMTPEMMGKSVRTELFDPEYGILTRKMKESEAEYGPALSAMRQTKEGLPAQNAAEALSKIPESLRREIPAAANLRMATAPVPSGESLFALPAEGATQFAAPMLDMIESGTLADSIQRINGILRRTPFGDRNKELRANLRNAKAALESMAEEYIKNNPQASFAAPWQQYQTVRGKYKQLMDLERMADDLPSDDTILGRAFAKQYIPGTIPNKPREIAEVLTGRSLQRESERSALNLAMTEAGKPFSQTGVHPSRSTRISPEAFERSLKNSAISGEVATELVREMKKREAPSVPKGAKMLDTFLPIKSTQKGDISKALLDSPPAAAQNFWKLAPEEAKQDVRGVLANHLIELATAKTGKMGRGELQDLMRLVAANKTHLDEETFRLFNGTLASIEKSRLAGQGMSAFDRIEDVYKSIAAFGDKNPEVVWPQAQALMKLDPEAALTMLKLTKKQTAARAGKNIVGLPEAQKDIGDLLLSSLLHDTEGGPSYRLYIDTIKGADPKTLSTFLGPDRAIRAKKLVGTLENMLPVLNRLQDEGISSPDELKRFFSAGAQSGMAAWLAREAGMGKASPGVFMTMLTTLLFAPKFKTDILLSPKSAIGHLFDQYAEASGRSVSQDVLSGAFTGAKNLLREDLGQQGAMERKEQERRR